jgi:hypothetical protein
VSPTALRTRHELVHPILPALQAVLTEIVCTGVDATYALGDR